MLHEAIRFDQPQSDPTLILESLQHPVIVIDRSNEITYANAIAAVSFGGWIVGSMSERSASAIT